MELSNDQKYALNQLMSWFKATQKARPYITLGGFAGTGKSTLISQLRKNLYKDNKELQVAFCSFTGKATRVLRQKLGEQKILLENDRVSTIHSLIYSPIVDEKKKEIIGWKRQEEIEADLIIVDEASMVDQAIWYDLMSYGKPIIAVGDHGQLPPINGNFSLMTKPDLVLTEIHRQAKENPIIDVSFLARTEGKIPVKIFGRGVKKLSRIEPETGEEVEELLSTFTPTTLLLCGYNQTRVRLNQFIRNKLGFGSDEPEANDRVICLRNNHEKEVYNGMLGTVAQIRTKNEDWYTATILMDEEEEAYEGQISRKQFNLKDSMNFTDKRKLIMQGDLFDFGYVLTVHKAQGSQAKKVVLFEERFSKMSEDDWRRWLYTGVTRAEEELVIIG
ncbi:DEAD/DEAH box helicase [Patescibacteria group bacterium]|nr:DEAD/DEAH box helicase [Patescibacteria group bacterium]